MQQQNRKIVTSSRRAYSIAQKVFCCKCFHSCQDVTLLTSDVRKQTLQKMIKNYVIQQDQDSLFDPLKLMILIYLCEDKHIPHQHIQRCRINPATDIQKYRTDLQFYIPQLCNSLVFHQDLKDGYLLQNMQKASRLNFYFGHLYFFYIISLEKIVDKYEIQVLKKVQNYKERFLQNICHTFEGQGLSSVQFYVNYKPKSYPTDPDIGYLIRSYGTSHEDRLPNPKQVEATDITLPNYSSIFTSETQLFSFKSTINFFQDLFAISEQLKTALDKKAKLQQYVMLVNQKLPASVYIPFANKSMRLCNILNIVGKQSRVFSTKERAPFYICIQTFNPCELLNKQQQFQYWEKIQAPMTLKSNFKSETNIKKPEKRFTYQGSFGNYRKSSRFQNQYMLNSPQTEILSQRGQKFSNDMKTQPMLEKSIELRTVVSVNVKQEIKGLFGQTLEEQAERISIQSIYSSLKTWQLIHLIVKTNDNLKQQQFALQLIYEFDYIFKLQNLPLVLTPYEVISMGSDCGVMQMVKQTLTIDSLKKKLKNILPKGTIKQFFEIYYSENISQAKQNFLKSLAAYSLVTYFLQAKDRHNGNILLHRSGKLLHIDFGFFLSNMPGKGVQLEKDIPFKLLTQYIDVLDGPQSYYFKKFRQYFFLGFKAARKHQNKILILVKMMYSSSGMTMPCFEKGQQTIKALQARFNPHKIINDAELNLFCQNLIDTSLDNWAAKWYDRFQYWAQGIVY